MLVREPQEGVEEDISFSFHSSVFFTLAFPTSLHRHVSRGLGVGALMMGHVTVWKMTKRLGKGTQDFSSAMGFRWEG